jgi:hypothetical protein
MGSMVARCVWILWLATVASAELVRIELRERSDVLDGRAWGKAGPYERMAGRAFFEVDPDLPANRIIADIALAPRNARGRVEFSADLYILKPRDPRQGNGTLLVEISNRGNKYLLRQFNFARPSNDPRTAEHLGDGYLLEEGYTLVWVGWQFDVPDQPDLLRLFAPAARGASGPITGLVRSEYVPDRPVREFSLGDRTMIAYPAADPDDPQATLTVRDRVEAPRKVIPRSEWRFAREEFGKLVPDPTRVWMKAGFQPGKIYEVVYRAKDPVVAGLGPAAVRDLVSYLKYGDAPEWALLSDQKRFLKRAIGIGTSQSGRFLRTFLYYGFNQDERGRQVFDGIIAHVAGGGRGSFNHRFAQPSRDGHPFMNQFYPTDIYPFADVELEDPETGLREGLLLRARQAGVAPKIFYTNSSYEYYGRAASLTHTTLDAKADVDPPPTTRIYLLAGTQHSPAAFPPGRMGTQNPVNPNDYRWPMRALLAAMQRWVAEGVEPPPSRYPRIGRGELVPLSGLRFPRLPGVTLPVRIRKAWRLDYGPEFRSAGIIAFEPPRIGKEFPVLVPQVDEDGNEVAGIRVPEVAVPLATYTGWNLRAPEIGAPDELYSMAGSWLPFARTRAERQQRGDPRRSIEERYRSRDDYLARVNECARELAREGYLLERDIPRIVEEAARRWDSLMR